MPAEQWTPRLTRGLWPTIQRAVREGVRFTDVGAAARRAGEAPDAATIAHLYSRAVGGVTTTRREADYRSRVDQATYLNRRPGGELIAPLPRGFGMAGRYRQVVAVTGDHPLTGQRTTAYLNVQSFRLLSRGEAMEQALASIRRGSPEALLGDLEAEYEVTWRLG